MMMSKVRKTLTLSAAATLGFSGAMFARAQVSEGPAPTQATVSVESKQPVELNPATIKVQVNGHETPLQSLTRVKPQNLQVAILVDEGLRTSFGLQIPDLKDFLNSLPPGTEELVGYMQNGEVVSHGFSTNHAAVADSVHLPEGLAGASASPYFCLSSIVKHWPAQTPGTRIVMMLTNGIDPYNGAPSVLNQDSPYVQSAMQDAQRAGVTVYAIPYHEAGLPGGAGSLSGQSYLQQVAEGTGGRLLYQGSFNPVSLKPFLQELQNDLRDSYTATFEANATHEKPNTLTRLKMTTSQTGVKLHAPEAIHPGLNETAVE